eukprot:3283465-Prymnesium_polylepis.1
MVEGVGESSLACDAACDAANASTPAVSAASGCAALHAYDVAPACKAVNGQSTYNHFWAGNLEGVLSLPLNLSVPERLVYAPHVYGPSVSHQPYFEAADFPANLDAIWDVHWGHVVASGIPVIVGEWGGWMTNSTDELLHIYPWAQPKVNFSVSDWAWHRQLSAYLASRDIGFFYWCYNPESSDTGGL